MSEVTELEDIILGWARQMFDLTKTREHSKINKEHLIFTINWKKVNFVHFEPIYKETLKSLTPKSHVLFRAVFHNNTQQEQEYTFSAERSTTSVCEIAVERGLTVGGEASLGIKLPGDILEMNTGFKREITVTNACGQTVEETLTWAVNSSIKVPPDHQTTAELVVYEDEFSGSFAVRTDIGGKVVVTVTNRCDNNSFLKSIEGDVAEILRQSVAKQPGFSASANKKFVSFESTGKCKFKYGIEQKITITESPI